MCAHGGTSDPLFRCLNRLKPNVLGTTLLVTGSHVMPMKCLFEPCLAYKRPCFGQ